MENNYHARARMASIIKAMAGRITRLAEERPAQKSVNEVLREYTDTLTRIAFDVLNGNMDKIEFRREHKELLRELAPEAYKEGISEGGGAPNDLDPSDIERTRDWIDEQVSFVNDFAAWLVSEDDAGKRNTESKRRELAERVTAWGASMRNLAQIAEAAAQGDPYLTFDGKPGEADPCDECDEYTGQRHKLSWWEKRGLTKRNGNDNYGCGRWDKCKHHFYNDDSVMVIE